MQALEPLHWEISASTIPSVNQEPIVTFYRTIDGQEDVRSRPFNRAELMTEIEIKKKRGDIDLSPWYQALDKMNQYLH